MDKKYKKQNQHNNINNGNKKNHTRNRSVESKGSNNKNEKKDNINKNKARGRSLNRQRNFQGNRSRSCSSEPKMPHVREIDRMQLIKLENESDPEYIILFLSKNQAALNKLLVTDDFNLIVLFLRVVSKLCDSNFTEKKSEILLKIINKDYLPMLQGEVANLAFQNDSDKIGKFYWEDQERFWKDLYKFYETVFYTLPQCQIIPFILSHINTLRQIGNTDIINKFIDLQANIINRIQSFRNMDILPKSEEVTRRNDSDLEALKQHYSSVDEYLDIHFKLLREDYVRSVRIAICNYLQNPGKVKYSDTRIYENVKFVQPFKSYDKIGIKVQIGQKTKEYNFLKHGNLVCFSKNKFKDIVFGTIIETNNENLLKDGFIVIDPISFDRITFDEFYTMIETKTVFETYFQVLQVLQNLKPENFPMKKYIVDGTQIAKRPEYLPQNCEINLDKPFQENGTNLYKFNLNSNWPPQEYFSLNSSQYKAFKTALTTEFSIIHGPPGTGKTYTSLKITEFLLKYKPNLPYKKPILVLCYSNHALNQFFNGILKFTNNILRINQRSKDDEYDIRYHRKQIQYDKDSYQKELIDEEQRKVDLCAKKFQCLEKLMGDINSKIGIIDFEHFKKIDQKLNNSWFDKVENKDIINWLIGETDTTNIQKSFKQPNTTNKHYSKAINEETVIVTDENINKFNENFILKLPDIKAEIKNAENKLNELKKQRNNFLLKNCEQEILGLAKAETYIQENLNRSKYHPRLLSTLDYSNPFNISKSDRWALYHTWIRHLQNRAYADIAILDKEYRDAKKRFYEVQNMVDVGIYTQKSVICMTTHSAAKFKSVLQTLKCEIVIIEEAAEILESHIVAALTNDCQQLILIGDHLQLRPNPQQNDLATNYNLEISLFERMVRQGSHFTKLEVQHRMRPEFARLISPSIYPELINDVSVLYYSPVRGMVKNLFFITHNNLENKNNTSRRNEYEAQYLLKLASYLIRQGYTTEDITILTSYKSQKDTLQKKCENFPDLKNIRIEVVDNFQGEENKIILLSLVRSNDNEDVGFLKVENRVCVLLSRAKEGSTPKLNVKGISININIVGFYMIGNVDTFQRSNYIWPKVVEVLRNENSIGPSLTLKCQIHNRETVISNLQDFDSVSSGGCDFLCGETLSCGHLCKYKCHPQDRKHEHFTCKETCKKVLCDKGHSCRLACSEPCKPCDEKTERCLPCGHFAEISCGGDPWEHQCTQIKTAYLPCGHPILTECYKNFSDEKCTRDCEKPLNCGHTCRRKCHTDDPEHQLYICKTPTVKKLNNCNHTITLPCSRKLDDRKCEQVCSKPISCSHLCKNPCGHHGQCRCNEKVEKHIPACGHTAKVKCHITPRQEYCMKRCQQVLDCGHRCIKKCNEYCDCGNYCNQNESDANCCTIL